MRTIGDLRVRAHRRVPRFVLEYLKGGTEDEATLARERDAFGDYRFLERPPWVESGHKRLSVRFG